MISKAYPLPNFTRPRLISIVLLAIGLTFFIALGNWQVSRARFKEALYTSFTASTHAPGVPLAQALSRWPRQSYVRAAITGQFIAQKTVLLDSQTANGQIGVQVFQAFQTADGAVLIGLGFMPIPPDRSSFPSPPVPSGVLQLQGLLSAPPSSGIKLAELGAAPNTATWLVTRIQPETFSGYFGVSLPKAVLLLDPVAPTQVPQNTAPADSAPANASQPNTAVNVLTLPRVWRPNTFGPERHRGYAATWYGFALTAVIIFLLLHVKRTPQSKEKLE